jgi:hypothetical protein
MNLFNIFYNFRSSQRARPLTLVLVSFGLPIGRVLATSPRRGAT